MNQLAGRLGEAVWPNTAKSLPSRYLLDIPDDLRAHVLNRHITDYPYPDKGVLVRGYKDQARAFLSELYGVADNTQLLTAVQEIVRNGGANGSAQSVRSYVTPDEMRVKIVLRNLSTPDGPYGIGFVVANGETGNTSMEMRGLIQRHSCTNSIVVADGPLASGWKRKHVGTSKNVLALFRLAAFEVLEGLLIDSAKALEAMVQAAHQRIGSFDQVLDKLAGHYNWSLELKIVVARGTENRETLGGLVNGISYAAHAAEISREQRTDLEILAGHVLMEPGHYVGNMRREPAPSGQPALAGER